MSDIKRVWTAEELEDRFIDSTRWPRPTDYELLAFLEKTTRLFVAFKEWCDEYPHQLTRLEQDDSGLVYDMRAALEEGEK